MPLTLYYAHGSPPSRSCLLLARHLKLDIELKIVDLVNGEQHKDEFVKLNPVKKVPVLVDGDLVLTESRAIMAYLVTSKKFGSDLYPTDPKTRAMIDQRLYYDATNVFPSLANLVRPVIFMGVKEIPQASRDRIKEVLKVLDGFIEGKEFFAGEKLTIADFSIYASVSAFNEMGYNFGELTNLNRWFEKVQARSDFEEEPSGAKLLADLLKSLTSDSLH